METMAVRWFPLSDHQVAVFSSLSPWGISSIAVPRKKSAAKARPDNAPSRPPIHGEITVVVRSAADILTSVLVSSYLHKHAMAA
jgi:hypothetical protein